MKKILAILAAIAISNSAQAQAPKGFDWLEAPVYGTFTGLTTTITFDKGTQGLLWGAMISSTGTPVYTWQQIANSGAWTNTFLTQTGISAAVASPWPIGPVQVTQGDVIKITSSVNTVTPVNRFVLYFKNVQR